ncbi:MAG: aminotransferase class I/II-fold pyridoxal phosphate-dependent enzyme [Peptococcaceae bacterium]|nr:aminotransferase class I/II-fold pyridoxal phosphate-dependent enzyme [Peptococcaceae bacterium]
MFNDFDEKMAFGTQILEAGAYFEEPCDHPEALPIHMSTAHNVHDLNDLLERYKQKGHCYNRNSNPNRSALSRLMSNIEGGEASEGFNCGMAAICTAIIANCKVGDHILSDKTLYGETLEIFTDIVGKYGVTTDFIDFTKIEEVKAGIKPNTTMLYTETVSNPLITVPDLRAVADIAHANGALLIVDNTFMTGALVRPLNLGADLVINSLTKFANGHSDALCGSVTGRKELIEKIYHMQILMGTQSNVFDTWLTMRGIRTLELRIHKQSENATAIAAALEKNPYVKRVFHPSLKSNPYHEIAVKETGGKYFGGMLTIELEDNLDKMNKFIQSLRLVHYAMTLGGYRTTMSYPPFSSHDNLTPEERHAIGISDGMLRISVGIEDAQDLVTDLEQALEKAYKE